MTRTPALLFDMDGVVCHNMPAHTQAWRLFFKKRGIELEVHEFLSNTMGMPTREVLTYYFKRKVAEAEADRLTNDKEALYRKLYGPKRRATPGLRSLLTKARTAGHRLG